MAPARRAMAVERVTLHVIGRPAKATTPGPDPVALERVTQTVVDRLDRTIEERVRKQLRPNSEQVRRLTEHICSDLYQHVVLEAERTGGRFGP